MPTPDEQGRIRNPDGTFPKGVSGNPNGRPKGAVSLLSILRQKLAADDGVTANELVDATIRDAKNGDAQARKLCWEYIEGKPTQPVDFSGETVVRIVDDVD